MAAEPGVRTLSPGRRLAVVLVPWLFMAVFAYLYVAHLLPRLSGLGWCFGIFVGLVFLSFLAAAVTFSRDVFAVRYPRD